MMFWRGSRSRSARMPRLSYALKRERYGTVLQDRATVIETGAMLVITVADGAGGSPYGDRADPAPQPHLA
jgi:hypothetical protein